jgi:hypothetical protein
MDVHKDTLSAAIFRPNDSIDVERMFHNEESVRRVISRFPQLGGSAPATRRARRAMSCIDC